MPDNNSNVPIKKEKDVAPLPEKELAPLPPILLCHHGRYCNGCDGCNDPPLSLLDRTYNLGWSLIWAGLALASVGSGLANVSTFIQRI